VANNFPFDISTSLRLRIIGTTVIRNDVFPITPALGPGEVRVLYFYGSSGSFVDHSPPHS
jgi:hypothetical protein